MHHLAVIADGNGRYGEKNGLSRSDGYRFGAKAIVRAINDFIQLPFDVLTFYTFSTENFKRKEEEVSNIFHVIAYFLRREIYPFSIQNGITIRFIGNFSVLPEELRKIIKEAPSFPDGKTVVFAINYGGDDEIVRACKKILLAEKEITVEELKNNLDTAGLPPVDAVIRFGGYQRLSNFLPIQTAYSELFFIDKLWPEYDVHDFRNVMDRFEKIKRNFGA